LPCARLTRNRFLGPPINLCQWRVTLRALGWDRAAGLDRLGIVTRGKEGALASYQARYGQMDPRRPFLAAGASGSVSACHHHLDDDFVSASEFFQDHLIPHGGRYSASMQLASRDGVDIELHLQRSVAQAPFSRADMACLTRLVPHLQRAAQLMFQLHAIEAQRELTQSMLEVSNLGVLALSACGTIVKANGRGEALLRSGTWLRQSGGRLHAVAPKYDAALHLALKDTLVRRVSSNLNFSHPLAKGHCCLTLMILPRGGAAQVGLTTEAAEILCLVAESGCSRVATVYQLIDLFALSPAEARLARSLAHGESLEAFADAQGVKQTTARSQLQNLLKKTGVGTQRELIRLVLSLPAVR